MQRTLGWTAAIAAIIGAIAALYYWIRMSTPEPKVLPPTPTLMEPAPAPTAAPKPQILYPVPSPTPAMEQPPPTLGESDAALEHELGALSNGKSLSDIILFDGLVRRFVATVDNLPRKKAPQRMLPVKNVRGLMLVTVTPDGPEISPQNSARYAAHVRLAESIDTSRLVKLYVRFYPLMQQAYRDLGYPTGYFNDRLIAAIDDLLAAPEVQVPLRLVQPKVMYQFADPELEDRSAGQKILIRMGRENAKRIKVKLREIRRALIALGVDRPGQ